MCFHKQISYSSYLLHTFSYYVVYLMFCSQHSLILFCSTLIIILTFQLSTPRAITPFSNFLFSLMLAVLPCSSIFDTTFISNLQSFYQYPSLIKISLLFIFLYSFFFLFFFNCYVSFAYINALLSLIQCTVHPIVSFTSNVPMHNLIFSTWLPTVHTLYPE
jgi:hypothetical protein